MVELKLVPLVELHDVTGGTSNQDLLNMVAYYTSAPVKQILLQFEAFLLINIANEWSGNDFRGGYTAAVQAMRTAGINHTLIIDANGFGQNAASIMTDGAALLAADPQHNLMFSVHMYESVREQQRRSHQDHLDAAVGGDRAAAAGGRRVRLASRQSADADRCGVHHVGVRAFEARVPRLVVEGQRHRAGLPGSGGRLGGGAAVELGEHADQRAPTG